MHENKGFSSLFTHNYFTMVEESFEFSWSEMQENEGFSRNVDRIISPWLKKKLNPDGLKYRSMKDF